MRLRDRSELTQEFLHDHRQMTRLLARLAKALRANEQQTIRELAAEVDRVAGPHIEFEELVLYPLVHQDRKDEDLVARLYHEHQAAREGVSLILDADDDQLDDPGTRALVAAGMEAGMEHAENCGTLISHLELLSPEKQQTALAELRHLRAAGHRWTELGEVHGGRKR